MKKKLLSVIMVVLLVASCCATAFAEPVQQSDSSDQVVQPRETNDVIFITDRVSSTKADIVVIVDFSQVVDQYSVVIYLQKLVNGSWQDDYSNDDYVYYNNGLSSRDFDYIRTYDDLQRGVTYRIKCVSKDYIGNSSHIMTCYSHSF